MEYGTSQSEYVRKQAIGTLLAAVIAVGACSEQPSETATAPERHTSRVAKLHNLALGETLDQLQQRANEPDFATSAELLDHSKGIINRFMSRRGIHVPPDDKYRDSYSAIRQYLAGFETGSASFPAALSRGGTAVADPFIARIMELIRTTTDPERLASALPAIEKDAANALTGDALARVRDAAAIALASARFWNENFSAWVRTICDNLAGCADAPLSASVFNFSTSAMIQDCGWDDFGEAGWKILGSDVLGGVFGPWGAAVASLTAAFVESVDVAYDGCD